MKLHKLFTAALTTAALSLSLSFSSNAELIVQSFDLEFEGGSATMEIAANTSNAVDFFDTEFLWEDDTIEYITFSNMMSVDVVLPSTLEVTQANFFDVFNIFSASAFLDSTSGSGVENGFFEIGFEMNLESISDMLAGVVTVELFNDGFGLGGSFEGFEATAGDFSGDITLAPGAVEVSAPATAALIFLSIAGLGFARRK